MDLTFLAGIVTGGLTTWGVAQLYYRKASNEQNTLFNKLSQEVREAILGDARKTLSVVELNKVLEDKTIDLAIQDPLPYKACPKCGFTDLARGSATDWARDDVYYFIKCPKCEWGDWTQ